MHFYVQTACWEPNFWRSIIGGFFHQNMNCNIPLEFAEDELSDYGVGFYTGSHWYMLQEILWILVNSWFLIGVLQFQLQNSVKMTLGMMDCSSTWYFDPSWSIWLLICQFDVIWFEIWYLLFSAKLVLFTVKFWRYFQLWRQNEWKFDLLVVERD